MESPRRVEQEPARTQDLGTDENSNLALPQPDRNQITSFLEKLGGPWHICPAIHWPGYTFDDLDDAVEAAIRANQEGCVYFLANTPKRNRLSGLSRKKKNIIRVRAVFLDIDDPDPAVVDELDRFGWPPTYVAFTGGGWQAMWRLSAPVSKKEGEAIAVWLQSEFEDLSPDSTHSCEHVFRLPGTRNRKHGRDNRLCYVYRENWSAVLPVEEAGQVDPAPRRRSVDLTLEPSQIIEEENLWEFLPPWVVGLRKNPTNAEGKRFRSRSEHEWAFIGACVRAELPNERIRDLLLMPAGLEDTHLVSHRTHWAKVKNKYKPRKNPEVHALRQIGSYLAKEAADV
ncbi:MAG: DNA-primase RepB domain-containing protein [Pseudomonadota bacterium]